MTLVEFIKLLFRNLRLMLMVALLMGTLVFYMTRNEKKQYTSQMVINTGVVSGYNIENHNSDSRVDRDYTRNELENLISLATAYETTEELALRLLARYLMLDEPDARWIRAENYPELGVVIPAELRAEVTDTSLVRVAGRLRAIRDENQHNPVFELLYSNHEFFGVDHLKGIKVVRKGASDLLEFTYSTTDPAVCQQTLFMLSEVITEKHRRLKESQSEDVLGFFEKATYAAAGKLREAEEKLLKFRVENNIINYYEQTRFIADKKEDLDEMFFKETMDLEATQATLRRLDEQLSNRGKLTELNQLLLDKREEISEITDKLAQYQILSVEAESISPEVLQVWQGRLEKLKGEMRDHAQEAYFFDQTPEGLASDDFLSAWLKAVIQLEQAGSRLDVIRQRKEEFTEIYSQFAPWGSRLKKIEREIALAEDAYLENLHSYNQARLHLQNTIMSANLQLLDAPFYPTREQSSKRMLLVVVAFMAGLILTLALVVVLEFLDQTLKHPVEAAKKLDLALLGVFPSFPYGKKMVTSRIDYSAIRRQAVHLSAHNLRLALNRCEDGPRKVLVTSTRGKEGVTYLTGLMVNQLRAQGKKVYYCQLAEQEPEGVVPLVPHPDNHRLGRAESTVSLEFLEWSDLPGKPRASEGWDYIFVEIPPLLSGRYPLALARLSDLALLICRANRTWSVADQQTLATFTEALGKKPGLIINGSRPEAMEAFLGELPRHRSRLRIFVKRLATFNFSGSTNI